MRRFAIAQFLRALVIAALVMGVLFPTAVRAQETTLPQANSANTHAPEWLEPRGLSVLDLVGQVPEAHLRGSILVFDEAGVTQYVHGERSGDKVTIEVSMSPYAVPGFTEFVCLGRRPILDEWPVPVPPSEMRIFSLGIDVTDQVASTYRYHPASQAMPIRGPNGNGRLERYFEYGFEGSAPAFVERTPSGALSVPANMGCTYFLYGSHTDLIAEFVFDYPQQVAVESLASETFSFHSYIGVGGAGRIQPLADQMEQTFGSRHDKFRLNIPPDADFVWLNYPPTPLSPYTSDTSEFEHNVRLPSSGTYRLIGYGDTKSVDHVVSMGLPLHAQWMDADLDGGSWLDRTMPIELLSAPEYFVPPGVPYDPCMRAGNCPYALLEEIFNKEAQMTIHYYRVRRLRTTDLTMVSLRQTGPDWSPSSASMLSSDSTNTTVVPPPPVIRLPILFMPAQAPTYPDDQPQDGCPCGWFDEHFRMLDLVPGT